MRKWKRVLLAAFCLALSALFAACGAIAPDGAAERLRAQQTRTDGETVTQTEGENALDAYLFVHFIGEGNEDQEQIYFSVSRDAVHWDTLNGQKPVLSVKDFETSKRNLDGEGYEGGVRDPHIVRSPDGNKFYLIATDLSIYNRGLVQGGDKWGLSQSAGSQYIVVWESENLADWSNPQYRKINRDDAGCTWAPESFYDKEKDAYMVFWSSRTKADWLQRVYRCYTEDFVTFTEPEVYIEAENSVIDATIIEHDDMYYRFTKNESSTYIYEEKCDSLSGDFTLVNSYRLDGKRAHQVTGYEGPTAFKLNGEEKWCLVMDNFGDPKPELNMIQGCNPYITNDIADGKFTHGKNFIKDDVTFRHGTILPITLKEYEALRAKYGVHSEEEGELTVSLDFEDNLEGAGTAVATGDTAYGEGVNGGKAVRLQGNYLQITQDKNGNNPLAYLATEGNQKGFTVSFAVKYAGDVQSGDGSWLFFASANNAQSWGSESYMALIHHKGDNVVMAERYGNGKAGNNRPKAPVAGVTKEEWYHVTATFGKEYTVLYINGKRMRSVASQGVDFSVLGNNPYMYLGYANWGSGEFSDVWLDGFRLYDYVLDDSAVLAGYKNVMGK